MVKNLPVLQEKPVQSLGQEDPLEKDLATHSSILAWRIPWTEEPGGLHSMGLQELDTTWRLNHHVGISFLNLWIFFALGLAMETTNTDLKKKKFIHSFFFGNIVSSLQCGGSSLQPAGFSVVAPGTWSPWAL